MNINAMKYFTINFISKSFRPKWRSQVLYTYTHLSKNVEDEKKEERMINKRSRQKLYLQNSTINVYLVSGKMVGVCIKKDTLTFLFVHITFSLLVLH